MYQSPSQFITAIRDELRGENRQLEIVTSFADKKAKPVNGRIVGQIASPAGGIIGNGSSVESGTAVDAEEAAMDICLRTARQSGKVRFAKGCCLIGRPPFP